MSDDIKNLLIVDDAWCTLKVRGSSNPLTPYSGGEVMHEDTYSQSVAIALDIMIRRLGWRLSARKLNPLAFKVRTEMELKTWGMIKTPHSEILRHYISHLSEGGIHSQYQYDRHLDFLLSSLDFYHMLPGQYGDHPFDELIPVLRDHDYQLQFVDDNIDLDSLRTVEHTDTHEWNLAPRFIAAQECEVGRELRSFGFIPDLDFLDSERYLAHVQ